MKLFPQFKFSKLKVRKQKKLRTASARRPLRATAQAAGEEMSEPNMKLSRALLIVLLLHVVAVSGIIAFNTIKTRQAPIASAPTYTGVVAAGSTNTTAASPSPVAQIKRAQPVGNGPEGSHKTYVVARGDNPVTIARKLKVSYDDLIALNHIDDPRKLRIGQKLLIPSKSVKGKKSDE